jgi:hypothetical protein
LPVILPPAHGLQKAGGEGSVGRVVVDPQIALLGAHHREAAVTLLRRVVLRRAGNQRQHVALGIAVGILDVRDHQVAGRGAPRAAVADADPLVDADLADAPRLAREPAP